MARRRLEREGFESEGVYTKYWKKDMTEQGWGVVRFTLEGREEENKEGLEAWDLESGDWERGESAEERKRERKRKRVEEVEGGEEGEVREVEDERSSEDDGSGDRDVKMQDVGGRRDSKQNTDDGNDEAKAKEKGKEDVDMQDAE